jgi:acyl-CoA synthetase (NDP forming)
LTTVPHYRHPEETARALSRSCEYADWQKRALSPQQRPAPYSQENVQEPQRIAAARVASEPGWLSAEEVMRVLRSCELATPSWSIARSEDEAVAAAKSLVYPVVLKALSPSVLHKSDVGGVVLDVRNENETRGAFRGFRERLPGTTAVLVQQYLPDGVETLVGVQRDPQFGHLIGFGIGGTLVEAVRDVHFRLHPLTASDADDLIHESLAARLMLPHRGRPAYDVDALRTALLRVSALLTALPQISQLDLNPLTVLPTGQGVCVLDARIRLGDAPVHQDAGR